MLTTQDKAILEKLKEIVREMEETKVPIKEPTYESEVLSRNPTWFVAKNGKAEERFFHDKDCDAVFTSSDCQKVATFIKLLNIAHQSKHREGGNEYTLYYDDIMKKVTYRFETKAIVRFATSNDCERAIKLIGQEELINFFNN